MMQRASLCRYEGLLMAKIRMMPVEAVEGGRLVVVSSKVSSNFLLTTSLIAASDVWYHSSMVVGVSIRHNSPFLIVSQRNTMWRRRGRGFRGLPFIFSSVPVLLQFTLLFKYLLNYLFLCNFCQPLRCRRFGLVVYYN